MTINFSDGTTIDGGSDIGKILQVQSTTKTSTFSTTGSSVDVTGLNVSITPSSSSNKVLVHTQITMSGTDNGYARLLRGSTAIAVGDASGSRSRGFAHTGYVNFIGDTGALPYNTMTLDSPNTTSSTTYKVQIGVGAGTQFVGRGEADGNNNQNVRSICTITAMEVKG